MEIASLRAVAGVRENYAAKVCNELHLRDTGECGLDLECTVCAT